MGTAGKNILDEFVRGMTSVDVLGWIRTNITGRIPQLIRDALGIHSPSSVMAGIGGNMMQGLIGGLQSKMPDIMSFMGNLSNVFGGVSGDVSGWMAAAIKATGVPDWWAGPLATIISGESGGNPRAANMTDVNALAGNPSVGLMQLTGTNRAQYTPSGLDPMDPIAQIIAGIRYIQARYGDISAVPGVMSVMGGGAYRPYDNGGWLPPGRSPVENRTGRPELVLPPGAGVGGTSVVVSGTVINVGVPAGTPASQVAALESMLPAVADKLWLLFGEQVLAAGMNQ